MDSKKRIEALRKRVNSFRDEINPKPFTVEDIEFLLDKLVEAEITIASLRSKLDPDGLNQRAMDIIRRAAKCYEN